VETNKEVFGSLPSSCVVAGVLCCGAVCCGVLRCVAVRCGALRCVLRCVIWFVYDRSLVEHVFDQVVGEFDSRASSVTEQAGGVGSGVVRRGSSHHDSNRSVGGGGGIQETWNPLS